MGQNNANVGCAVLDMSGGVAVADEVFRAWLGGRSLAELLPEFRTHDALSSNWRSTRLCPADSKPSFADVECKRLDGTGGASLLVRVEVVGNMPVESEYRDIVTGLPDRRALAAHRMKFFSDANGSTPHAVLFLDLDNFKQINDSLGHAVGDRVLAILAERWRKSLRGRDLIVRYGGDEFVVLLAGVRSDADVQPIVDRLQSTTVAPIQIDGHTLQVSVAIGVARADDASVPLEELLDSADRAMYSAKRQGC